MLLSGFKEGLDLDDAAVNRNKSRRNRRQRAKGGSRKQAQMNEQDTDCDEDDDEEEEDDVIELHFDDPQVSEDESKKGRDRRLGCEGRHARGLALL